MRLILILLGLMLLRLAGSPSPPLRWQPQHPQLHDARTTIERDEDTGLLTVVVTVDIVDDGAGWTPAGQTPPTCAAAYTVSYRSATPPAPYEITWMRTAGAACGQGSQLPHFVRYLGGALGCEEVDLAFYDPAPARNGRSPQSMVALARNLSQLRSAGPFNCPLPPLPPQAAPACGPPVICPLGKKG